MKKLLIERISKKWWNEVGYELYSNPLSERSIAGLYSILLEEFDEKQAKEIALAILEGGGPIPPKKEEVPVEKELEDDTMGMMTQLEKETDTNNGVNEYIDLLPDNDPTSEEEITELLEAFFEEDIEVLDEARILKPENVVGTKFFYKGGEPFLDKMGFTKGTVFTIIPTQDKVDKSISANDEYKKSLQSDDGKIVTLSGGNQSYTAAFGELKGSGGPTPSGEDWEALIITAYNGIDENSKEWKRVEKFWASYADDALKIAESFKQILKSKKLSQLGSDTAALNPDWRGTNRTPKTDILGDSNEKISLKKSGGSQLMSAGKEETLATFEAAMKLVGENQPALLKSFLDGLETKMGKMSEVSTITALQKLRDSGDELTSSQEKAIAEMEQLQLNAKEITKDMETIFKDIYFKSCFCFEAATGTNKFADKNAIANQLIEFNETGKITANLSIKKINDAKVLASKNSFFVSFKSGGGAAWLALRTKSIPKSQLVETITLKDIITEEFSKYNFGERILLESDRHQLNEFQLFNKLAAGLKNVSTKVKNQVKNILSTIIARVKEAIDYIKTLGGKMFNAILNFLGMEVTNVNINTSGPFPLI